MTLLHQPTLHGTVLDTRQKVARFMLGFIAMLGRATTCASVANRITMEQVFWQVGVRLPLAHFAGFHLVPPVTRKETQEALIFRTKSPQLAFNFVTLLKVFARLNATDLELVDMNNHASLS